MKKNLFKLSWLLIAAFISFTACNDDDDGETPILVEDGIYVKGVGTALTDLDAKGKMKVTRNEVVQEERAQLLELYIAVKGGSDGFNIVEVAGATTKTYGPDTDFVEITGDALNGEEPTEGLWKGTYKETATKFTVPTDALYHVIIDTELKKVAVAKVTWGIIGAATPGGWSSSTALTAPAFDLNSMTFSGTEIEMTKADFKFRYSSGWKIILDTEYDLGAGLKGIKVNTNFGGAFNALVPGGANIANETPGIYTIEMKWTLGGAYAATATKTGESSIKDYTNTELGLVGDGIIVADTANGWNFTMGISKPTAANTTYTWRWTDVNVVTTGSFKIREGQTWNDMSLGYPQVTMAGSSAANFGTNTDGNFVPVADGVFDFTLTIDAATDTYTFTAEPGNTPVPDHFWGIIGSSVAPYDWSVDVDMTWNYNTNVWSITTDLVVGEFKFRADNDWTLAYGIDVEGNLTTAGGSPNIPIAEAGNYTIQLILTIPETPTYTVTKN
jgi:hypothetical protein